MSQQFTFKHSESKVLKADAYYLVQNIPNIIENNIVYSVQKVNDSLVVLFENALLSTEVDPLKAFLQNYLDLLPEDTTIVEIAQSDEDTDGVKTTVRWAPIGWAQQCFETEFTTSLLDSIHEKNANNEDIGWSSLHFWKLVEGVETKWNPQDQADLDANCVRTDIEWMPDIDYMIKGGFIAQKNKTDENVYFWTQGVVLPEQFGGAQFTFVEGGVNLFFVNDHSRVGVDGVSGTILYYDHPQLGTGMGTNKMRTIVRHPLGHKHRLQMVFEIFRAA